MPSASAARAFLRIALAAVVLAVFAHTRADPDLWGHVRFGGDLVAAHRARLADTYAFDSDRPWINHEWLAEIAMYAAFAAAGGTGLILLKVLLLVAMTATVSLAIRAGPIPAPAHDLLIGLLLVGTVPQASHVRPQLFSLVLFALLLALLAAAARGRRAALVAVPPLMALWANLHGGWIVGAGILGVWSAGRMLSGTVPRPDRLAAAAAAAAGIAATLANPNGWRLWAFLRDTVGLGRAEIVDWQPVFALGAAYGLLWALVLSVALVAVWAGARRRDLVPSDVIIVGLLAIGAFRVNRLLAFFTIAVVVLLHRPLIAAAQLRQQPEERTSPLRSAVAIVLGGAILAGSLAMAGRSATCVAMDPADYPDPGMVSRIDAAGLHGRLLTWFGWGEYAIWHLARRLRVSIDGRRETVYTDATIQRHLRFYFVPDEREQILDVLKPDYIWLPATLPVVRSLEADGWQPAFAGTTSVLLARRNAALESPLPGFAAARCFPGP